MRGKLLFVVPVYSMPKDIFNDKWNKFFKDKGWDKEQLRHIYFLPMQWKYNQIIAFIEIYKNVNDIDFVIFKSNHKRYRYTTNKHQFSYYLTNGNHFYIRKNDTNEDIKNEICKMLKSIKKQLKEKNLYLDLEAFNNQIKYMDIKNI
ncbi:hypothetical protein [Enterocloster lavalensis]|uniref:hypothetical protein n=1 Tax=Enterocloster lavalensis TaxID=460384 RepID=UPI0023F0E6FA|nr:hypothetical protein [Enterocloster lavalensis]